VVRSATPSMVEKVCSKLFLVERSMGARPRRLGPRHPHRKKETATPTTAQASYLESTAQPTNLRLSRQSVASANDDAIEEFWGASLLLSQGPQEKTIANRQPVSRGGGAPEHRDAPQLKEMHLQPAHGAEL
jgi:hypothetical protein